MRDYVTKVENGGTSAAGQLSAQEFNEYIQELENLVTRGGLTLDQATLTQLAQSAFLHGTKAGTFQAGGTVDALQLTPISGLTGVLLPANYDAMGGSILTFLSLGANTGAVTINLGQDSGSLIGTSPLVSLAGAALIGGEVPAAGLPVSILRDDANNRWVLLTPASATQPFEIIDSGSISPNSAELDVTWGSNVYSRVEFEYDNLIPVAGNDATVSMRFSTDDGTSFDATAGRYQFVGLGLRAGGVNLEVTSSSANRMNFNQVDGTGVQDPGTASGIVSIMRPSLARDVKRMQGVINWESVAGLEHIMTHNGQYTPPAAAAVNGFRIQSFDDELDGAGLINLNGGDYIVRGWF